MTSLFDFDVPADFYAVMGNPISHSKSPQIHTLFAQQTQQKIRYDAIQVDVGGFQQALGNFQLAKGCGLNVTLPFKTEAYEAADELSDRAEQAGAVNTLSFKGDQLLGDNTDGVGLVRDLLQNHPVVVANKKVLLLGAGGAARGVIAPLLAEQPEQIVVANRTVARAEELASRFDPPATESGVSVTACGFSDLTGKHFDLIVNATAASLQGELPPLPASVLRAGGAVYDMMYGKEPTTFMRWAINQSAGQIMDGLGMLVEQAAESFYLWRGVRPDTRPVIKTLRENL